MKQLILKLFFAFSIFLSLQQTSNAQTNTEIEANGRSYSQIFDSLSTGLIPSRIPYGVLMDRVYGWSGLTDWNNGDTVTASHLFQSWFDAEQAFVNAATRPNNYTLMRDAVQQQVYEVKLPVISFCYQFGYFDSLALTDGRLSEVNGILTDNNNASPYLSKQITFAGIATEDIVQTKSYALQYSNTLILNNTSFTIQSIVVKNITSNIEYTLTVNTAQVVQFTTAGTNLLRFTINLSNGTSYISYQKVDIKATTNGNGNIALKPAGPNCVPVSELLTSNIPFQGYTETFATNSHADYHTYYHTQSPAASDCERVLRKPIIIIDGFNPEDDRKYSKIYGEQLSYSKNGVPTLFGDELRDKGYDIIILNFPILGSVITDENKNTVVTIPSTVKINGTNTDINLRNRDGGADYIERNAMLLIKLIQQLNATLAANGSTEKLVIVGPSMGGLVSRYALAYMEKQQSLGVPNMNHNCRLWVSFDSPHDGANISLAAQQSIKFLGYTTGDQTTIDKYEKKLRATAARQQLIEQMDGLNSNATFHNTFFTNLKNNGLPGSNGFPVNLRRVALLNGTGNGTNTYWPEALVLSGEAFKRILGNDLLVFNIKDNFMSTPGAWQRTSKTFVTLQKPLKFISETWYVLNNNSRGCMDAVQGSFNNEVIIGIKDGSYAKLESKHAIQNWLPVLPNFCFVPSISALGFKQPVANWHTRVDNRNLLCNNEINFESYFLPQTNEKHIFLTEANVNWVMQEIEKGQPGCPSICSFTINGTCSQLSVNAISSYSLDVPAPSGTTVQWTVSSNLLIVSSTNSSVTVKGVSTGNAVINARIVNPCGADMELKKDLTVVLSLPMQLNYVQNNCNDATISSSITNGSSYSWQVDGDLLINGTSTTLTTTASSINITGTGGSVYVSIPLGCGSATGGINYTPFSREIQGLYPEYIHGDHVSVSVNTTPYDTYYRWYINNTLVKEGASAYNYCTCAYETPEPRQCGDNTIRVEVETSCGTSSFDGGFFWICSYRMMSNVIIYPNPASDQVTVSLTQVNDTKTTNKLQDIKEIKVLDKYGNVKKIQKYPANSGRVTLNLSNLLLDIYIIEVSDGKNTAKIKLSLQK